MVVMDGAAGGVVDGGVGCHGHEPSSNGRRVCLPNRTLIDVAFCVSPFDRVVFVNASVLYVFIFSFSKRRAMSSLSFVVTAAAAVSLMAVIATVEPSYRTHKYSLFMPNIMPKHADSYLCTSAIMYSDLSYFVVGFEPKASSDTVHHMLLFGCKEPGTDHPVWNCGTAMQGDAQSAASNNDPCKSGEKMLYAWARDAPALELPADVGFGVAGDSGIDHLVLQIHYRREVDYDELDNSGLVLHYTTDQLRKRAGVYLLATGGEIRANSVEHMETACPVVETGKVVHPFAYRVHTHQLGKVVAGYRVRTADSGEQKWQLLGKRDPMTSQMFYPIEKNITVEHGDLLAVRCTMESDRAFFTIVGPTGADEMCNFYVMYWVEDAKPLQQELCRGEGPPLYYWKYDPSMNNIPDEDASTL